MKLFSLGHSNGNPCQSIENSIGTHMSQWGEPCSQYRGPETGEIEHVIERVVNGIEVEARAIGECPKPAPSAMPEVSSLEATH